MKILATVGKNYYGRPDAVEPMYLEFTEPLKKLGHHVSHFDHMEMTRLHGPDACGEMFVERIRKGGYDLVLYQTAGADQMARGAIGDASRHSCVVAWNSDDDWQWDSYCQHIARSFTFMVTTYPKIYDANHQAFPNLLLSQWGCIDIFANAEQKKIYDFAFAGWVYGCRIEECKYLRRHAGLRVFGRDSGLVTRSWLLGGRLERFIQRRHWGVHDRLRGRPIYFNRINDIWNRSKISFTPMSASTNAEILQIKSRTFEMGCSGTLMLCQHSPNLERYYEPDKEFVSFVDMSDCAAKARYYLKHDSERERIAQAYLRRTRAEHMWEHRYKKLFQELRIQAA